jgi:hypothetical protein
MINMGDEHAAEQQGLTNQPVLPNFGLTIACEKPTLMICPPKLLPLKTYSYMRMQAINKIDQQLTNTKDAP